MFNPFGPDSAVLAFVKRHCKVIPERHALDDMGIWTGNRQYRVILEADEEGWEGLRHLPASFCIATDRGFLTYTGQPVYCHRCFGFGHETEGCRVLKCRNCGKEGHSKKSCPNPKRFDVCGLEGHLAGSCAEGKDSPSTYAQAAAGGGKKEKSGANQAPVQRKEVQLERVPASGQQEMSGELGAPVTAAVGKGGTGSSPGVAGSGSGAAKQLEQPDAGEGPSSTGGTLLRTLDARSAESGLTERKGDGSQTCTRDATP
ncbi:hypothetical protein SKAU_G00387220 [Synaphobranchus kaupii]|uniref:CCHC-type domain-containing protein n=1 Tax=Synaphobranchus kaupii TaxID=118154 RepID=A0A9Q1EAU0_SYNKA|nr:hypothetical protein SKAU_G00387220 [Synaphobranchus kaupii]